MLMSAKNVSHGFGERTILKDATFRLLKGEHIGLIGANGEGKTTFINILLGNITPDEGKIEWAKRLHVGYLDQYTSLTEGKTIREVLREAFHEMFELEQEISDAYMKMCDCTEEEMNALLEDIGEMQSILDSSGFYLIDKKIEEVASGLGLMEIGLDKDVTNLSGGQRSKVLLTKLLLQNPQILILDEPTNFLDENHINWLKNYLMNFENAFILISHEMGFLNSVVNVIYHIEQGNLTRYSGNYEQFMQAYEVKKNQQNALYEAQQREIKDLEDFIARNKARVSTRNMAASRQKKLDKMELIEKVREKVKPEFNFNLARTPGRVLFSCKDLVLGYDSALSKPINLDIFRNEKIAIKGVNGIGKSTLLKTLLQIVKPFNGSVEMNETIEVGYFEQEAKDNRNTALQEVWDEYPHMENYEVRGALASCGLTTSHIETLMLALSGGENAKVRLCKLMLKETNCLVLDEPTNHLDVLAKDALKEALQKYKGTIILVSHDPEFYNGLVDKIINAEEYSLKII
jgi:ATPase subunit of ABC transporter with duplicated ATPase domains